MNALGKILDYSKSYKDHFLIFLKKIFSYKYGKMKTLGILCLFIIFLFLFVISLGI